MEKNEQKKLVCWLRQVLPKFDRRVLAVANERQARGKRAGAIAWRGLVDMGASAGAVDLLIPGMTPKGGFGGVAIEMKRLEGGAWRPGQRGWLLYWAAIGWASWLCCGEAEARARIMGLGYE